MLDTLLLLIVLGSVNHQIACIVTEGVIFQGFRDSIRNWYGAESNWYYLFTCHLCFGTWVGLLQGLLVEFYGARIIGVPQIDWLLIGFSAACLGRLFNEVLALLSANVSYKRTLRAREEQELWLRQGSRTGTSK